MKFNIRNYESILLNFFVYRVKISLNFKIHDVVKCL